MPPIDWAASLRDHIADSGELASAYDRQCAAGFNVPAMPDPPERCVLCRDPAVWACRGGGRRKQKALHSLRNAFRVHCFVNRMTAVS